MITVLKPLIKVKIIIKIKGKYKQDPKIKKEKLYITLQNG